MAAEGDKRRRSYGSGHLFVYRASWYAKWYVGSRQVKRKVGAVRPKGSRDGLTRSQAEREMRKLIREVKPTPQERLTLTEVGDAYIAHLRDLRGRKASTIQDYEGILRRSKTDLPKKTVERLAPADFESLVTAMRKRGLSAKTIGNHLIFLHGLFAFAVKRGWTPSNPVASVERPVTEGADPDIRFIDPKELDALLEHIPDDDLGAMERPLYVTAAMAGLRQGELIALRRRDVDFKAGVIRVRRNFTRGRFGTPKSRRSSRAVPMAKAVAKELRKQFQRSRYKDPDDLVFCHPDTGGPYDPSKMRKRFKDVVEAAGIRAIRFHDLRHTFGTRMAAAGAPLRSLQEWMGHRDYKTTEIYADYAPDPEQEAKWVNEAFSDPPDPSAEEDDADLDSH